MIKNRNHKIKRIAILYYYLLFSLWSIPMGNSQLAVPVIDPTNNATGAIIKVIQDANELIRETMLPFKENIAHIVDLFKDAQGKVNIVFKNLDLLKGVLDLKKKISDEFLATLELVNDVDALPQNRWKYRWQLAHMWYNSRDVLSL